MGLLMALGVGNNLLQLMVPKMIKVVCGSSKRDKIFPFVKLDKLSNVEMSLDSNIFIQGRIYTPICSNLHSQIIKKSAVLVTMEKVCMNVE
jgi:hypothetical protein